ncbi:MAG: FixH family protein [Nitrospirae bacterium]|nr:FixH family protein [Nitrospirota bacterium]
MNGISARQFVIFAAALFMLALFGGSALAAELALEKKVDGITISATLDHDPPAAGKNNAVVKLTDSAGKPLGDAKVIVEYGMEAHGMSSKVAAKFTDGAYKALLDLSMGGDWYIEVKVQQTGGKKVSKARFDVKVK